MVPQREDKRRAGPVMVLGSATAQITRQVHRDVAGPGTSLEIKSRSGSATCMASTDTPTGRSGQDLSVNASLEQMGRDGDQQGFSQLLLHSLLTASWSQVHWWLRHAGAGSEDSQPATGWRELADPDGTLRAKQWMPKMGP